MITPTEGHLLVRIDKPETKKDGFEVAQTNKYLRLNSGVVEQGERYEGNKVFFRDFSGVDIDENLIVIPVEDIVAVEDNKERNE